ncbi:MAG: hypothetical protein JNL87_17340 [Burkholderiaceae bacterium]|nr:hypothetical protein [Burkholderiaceae bacterium]
MSHKLAPLPATLATAALAASAALGLTACLGEADLLEAGLPAASQAGCDWLRQVDVLDGRLVLDYREAAPLAGGARLQRHHAADVQGTLRLLQRDDRGVVWSGALKQGRMSLDDRQVGPAGATAWSLAGRGAPGTGPGLAGTVATLRLDLADCSLQIAARLALPAVARDGRSSPATMLQEMGRLAISGLDARGGPTLAGTWRVPVAHDDAGADLAAVAAVADDGLTVGRYRPAGPAAEVVGPGGTALVRWQFRART